MLLTAEDSRWLAGAAALAERARPISRPNPGVGAIIVKNGRIVGRGSTQAGGRPHAEAMALEAAGNKAAQATLYVTLEPCVHQSERGPACAELVAQSGLARAVIGMRDPDPRTTGAGIAQLEAAGINVCLAEQDASQLGLSGHEAWLTKGRPHITLKLALSLDGCIATASGESQWITGEASRAHSHRERARADAILIGGKTLRTDNPRLTVRLPGLEDRSPDRLVLTRESAPDGWTRLATPEAVMELEDVRFLFIEGGAGAAAAFLARDLVDRLLIYRAPVVIGGGMSGIDDIGLRDLTAAHGRWLCKDMRRLGQDILEIYSRTR